MNLIEKKRFKKRNVLGVCLSADWCLRFLASRQDKDIAFDFKPI